jgi:CTP synthase (UTP-ammonia lyase)
VARTAPVIGVIGDFDPNNPTHRFTNEALAHAGVEHVWLPTEEIERGAAAGAGLGRVAGLLIAPGSPYRSKEGAIEAVRYARERGVPLVGT